MRRVDSQRHVEKPNDLSLFNRCDAFLLELNKLPRGVASDQVGLQQHVNTARLESAPASGERASTRRLLTLPVPRTTKWNGADPRCVSLMISSAASASRRLRSTYAPNSSSSSSEFPSLSFEPRRKHQFSADVRTAAPAGVGCARDVPNNLKSCMIPLAQSIRISGTCVRKSGSQSF